GDLPRRVARLFEIVHVAPSREHHPAIGLACSFAVPDHPRCWRRPACLACLPCGRQTKQPQSCKNHSCRGPRYAIHGVLLPRLEMSPLSRSFCASWVSACNKAERSFQPKPKWTWARTSGISLARDRLGWAMQNDWDQNAQAWIASLGERGERGDWSREH